LGKKNDKRYTANQNAIYRLMSKQQAKIVQLEARIVEYKDLRELGHSACQAISSSDIYFDLEWVRKFLKYHAPNGSIYTTVINKEHKKRANDIWHRYKIYDYFKLSLKKK